MKTKIKTAAKPTISPEKVAEINAKLNAERGAWELEKAVSDLRTVAERAERLAVKLHHYADEIKNPPTDNGIPVTAAERYTWAINEVENYIRNINFANLASNVARISE